MFRFLNVTTFCFIQCITFNSPIYRSHKDLDVLLSLSSFFISAFFCKITRKQKISVSFFFEINQTSRSKNLRQPCNICEIRKVKENFLNLVFIQKLVRFACIIELSNMIQKWFSLTPNSLNFNLAIVLFW